MDINCPPACVFEADEIGNKEFSWSGLREEYIA